jgi:truncated hemoglobin YjbI
MRASLTTLAILGLFTFAPACDGGGKDATDDTDDTTEETDDTTTEETDDTTEPEPTCETDVCATYGAAVPTVANNIVDAAAADPQFSADFAPLVAAGSEAVAAFKTSLANFISDAYGCTSGAYTGPSMEAAHTGLGITQEEYDAFIGLIAAELAEAGVPDNDINYCFAPPLVDPAFVATIINL